MSFYAELKRRNVFKVGAAYAVVAWVVMQVVDIVLPTFDAPRWVNQTLLFLIILGFPVALMLAWVFELTPDGIKTTHDLDMQSGVRQQTSRKLNYILGAGVALILALLVVDWNLPDAAQATVARTAPPVMSAPVSGVQRVSIVLPPELSMPVANWPSRSIAISPDGATTAFVGPRENSGSRDFLLHVRKLAARETLTLPETNGARQPFFSPDGMWIAFFTTEGELKKVRLSGGRPVTLATELESSAWAFGVWLEDDRIVFTAGQGGHTVFRIGADGAGLEAITTADRAKSETNVGFPVVLPGQARVLLSVTLSGGVGGRHIEVLDLATLRRQPVLDNATAVAVLTSGHLLFERDGGTLLAPFDAATLRMTGPAVPVPDAIGYDTAISNYPLPEIAVSANGTLAYLPVESLGTELGFLSPGEAFQPLGLPADYYRQPRVAPDGRTLSYLVGDGLRSDMYRYDLERGTTSRLSQDGAYVRAAAWRPDGLGMAVAETGQGISLLDNAGKRTLVPWADGEGVHNMVWTPDGDALVYTREREGGRDLWLHRLDSGEPDRVLAAGPAGEIDPALSPDGRWLAYSSDESGQYEILVKAFPDGVPQTVSSGGGVYPLWSNDGAALYFIGLNAGAASSMTRVAVSANGDTLQLGPPEALFAMATPGPAGISYVYRGGTNSIGAGYDILPDGRFVLMRSILMERREIVLVQNWSDEARMLAPVTQERE